MERLLSFIQFNDLLTKICFIFRNSLDLADRLVPLLPHVVENSLTVLNVVDLLICSHHVKLFFIEALMFANGNRVLPVYQLTYFATFQLVHDGSRLDQFCWSYF